MPEINIADSAGRDALVAIESVASTRKIRWVDAQGRQSSTARLMKGPITHDIEALKAKHGELAAHHLSDPHASDYRQLCADAYAVQHPGRPGLQATQSVGGHLVNLFAQVEVGLPVARAAAIKGVCGV